jgi:hypothetical protein
MNIVGETKMVFVLRFDFFGLVGKPASRSLFWSVDDSGMIEKSVF